MCVGWIWCYLFHCMPDSTWANRIWQTRRGQMVEQQNQIQNSTQSAPMLQQHCNCMYVYLKTYTLGGYSSALSGWRSSASAGSTSASTPSPTYTWAWPWGWCSWCPSCPWQSTPTSGCSPAPTPPSSSRPSSCSASTFTPDRIGGLRQGV